MTPGYASPEQMKGDRITTSSDVYSLGVILYELLTGKRPYRLTNDVSAEEVSHAIAEQELERPSTAVLQDSRLVGQDSHSLRGDLDNIVLMALRKEPERRYNSAAALAEDIERYHTGLPVVAHQDSLTYRVSKFVRRHKAGVIAAVLVLLAILAGMTGTLWQSHLARVQRAKAERRFNDVRKLATSNLFEVYPEVENLAGSLKARESILKNALQYLDSLAREAGDDLELQSELATGYEKVGDVQGALNNSNLGNIKAGLETYRKANALRAAIVAASPNDLEAKEKLARNEYTIARTLWLDSQTREAEKAFEKALKLWRELVAAKPDSPALKDKLAVTLIDYAAIPAFDGQSEKTLALANEALAIVDQLREKDPADPAYKKTKARLLRILSKPKAHLGDYAGGLKALDGALVLSKEVAQQLPNDFPAQRAVWLTQSMTCELFIDKGDGLEAVEACRGTIDFPRQALTHEPENGVIAYDLAISYFNLARACRLSRDFSQTIENSKAAMKVMEKLQATSPEETDYLRNLAVYKTEMARAQIALNQSGEAIAVLEEAEKLLQPIVEAGSESATFQEDLGMVYRLSAQAYHQKNDDENAIERVDKAITIVRKLKKQSPTAGLERNLLSELETEKASYSK
jgi:tetratricopeptide (TPR) repeat protein